MKRLSDLPADDRLSSRAHALIRATGATLQSDERRLRVRRLLDARLHAALPCWGGRVGPALALLGVSAAAAGSSAMASVLATERSAADTRSTLPSGADHQPPVAARAVLLPERVVVAVRTASSASPLTSAPMPTSRTVSPPPLSDVARVHEAAKALRQDGDAERALHLLERGAPVTGPLAEEALALRIEASVARGSRRQAKLAAAAYLTQYPLGRYRALAKKALSGSGQ